MYIYEVFTWGKKLRGADIYYFRSILGQGPTDPVRSKLRCLLLRRKKFIFLYIYEVFTWGKKLRGADIYYFRSILGQGPTDPVRYQTILS
jgi:hypothetical protein